jgi:predicted metal-binding membrane protein
VLAQILRRDRLIVLAGVAGLGGLAWLELWRHHGAMAMDAATPRPAPWALPDLGAAAIMWAVMMIAMMVPSAAPVLLIYDRVERDQRAEAKTAAPTGFFALGYLIVWIVWSLAAAALQWALQALVLLSPRLASTTPILSAAFLLVAGTYQLTPWKDACLAHCQSPLGFLLTRWRAGPWGALRMGLHHGAYCVGCCWALMGLLFVGGVMNLIWVAVLAGFVLLEKAVARGPWLSRVSGIGLVMWGAYLLLTAVRS